MASSPQLTYITGEPSSFTSPQSDRFRSPHSHPSNQFPVKALPTIHLEENSKISTRQFTKGMSHADQQHLYQDSDEENRDSSNSYQVQLSPLHKFGGDRPHSPFTNSATSGIAAMSLSYIINDDDQDLDEYDEYDEELDEGDESASNVSDEEMKDARPSFGTESSSSPPSSGGFDVTTMLNTVCAKPDCYRTIRGPEGSFCKYHKQSRFCRAEGCTKSAKTGGFCISHGGGKRCSHPDCTKSAKQGGLCISHGGGKRCSEAGCTKSALVGGFCSAHGGGRKCKTPNCTKTALLGGNCIAHGGGKRCQVEGCSKSAVGGTLCVSHGGGKRCQAEGCSKGAVRNGVCIRHGAKRDNTGSEKASASP